MIYKLIYDELKNRFSECVYRLPNYDCIPFDPSNTSYQEYLQWLAEGNEPLPADEPEEQPVGE